MKKTILLLTMAFIVFACKKKEVAPVSPNTPAPVPAPTIKTVANYTVENRNSYTNAYANISYVQGQNNNAGTVAVSGLVMGNPYIVNNSTIAISSPVIWTVQGAVLNPTATVPSETITAKNVPNLPVSADIDTSKTVDANFDYTINNQNLNCDSVVYEMSSVIVKNVAGNTTSITFKSAELKNASYGIIAGGSKNIMVSISAYNSYVVKVGDYNWRFISKSTNVQYLHFKN